MDYTKGEWKVNKEMSFESIPFYVIRSIIPKPDGRIQRVADTWIEANAHLIAAAPDMYEALRAICESEEIAPHIPTPIWNFADMALFKAEGK